MKKNLVILLVMFVTVTLFSSCKDDDKSPTAVYFSGSYLGTFTYDVSSLVTEIPMKAYLTKTSDTHLKLELKNLFFNNDSVGTITVNAAAYNVNDGTVTFSVAQADSLGYFGQSDLSLSGTIVSGQFTMNLSIISKENNNRVSGVFSGDKLKSDKSSEAEILKLTFNEGVTSTIIDGKNITFNLPHDADITALVPTIELSKKATVSPLSDVAQDFSTGSVIYTVTSEDSTVVSQYTVSFTGHSFRSPFEAWSKGESGDYYVPNGGWATADLALVLVTAMIPAYNDGFSVEPTSDAMLRKAAKIRTLNTIGAPGFAPFPAIPKVTSGSLFLGRFEVDIENTLRSTRFGIEYTKKPLSVKGYYKYTPGPIFYKCTDVNNSNLAEADPNTVDSCSLSAILYEVNSYDDAPLDGTNIYTSDKIVAVGMLDNGAAQPSWKPFELKMQYIQAYDPTKLYRFAVIFSSSKEGNKFCGAHGSTLYVDEVDVISEK